MVAVDAALPCPHATAAARCHPSTITTKASLPPPPPPPRPQSVLSSPTIYLPPSLLAPPRRTWRPALRGRRMPPLWQCRSSMRSLVLSSRATSSRVHSRRHLSRYRLSRNSSSPQQRAVAAAVCLWRVVLIMAWPGQEASLEVEVEVVCSAVIARLATAYVARALH